MLWVPAVEKVTEVGDCSELVVIHLCRRVLHSAGEEVEGVYDAVALADLGLGEVVVH